MFKTFSFFISISILLFVGSCGSELNSPKEPIKTPVQEIKSSFNSYHILLFKSERKLEIWSQDQKEILQFVYQHKFSTDLKPLIGKYEEKEDKPLTFKLLDRFYQEKIKLKIKGYQSNTYPLSNTISLLNLLDAEAKKILDNANDVTIDLYLFPHDFRSNSTPLRSMVSRHYDTEMYAFLENTLLKNYKNGE